MEILHKLTTVSASLKPYEEYFLSGLFLLVGLYAYIQAQSWGFAAGTWPRLTAGIVVILSALILSKRFLPEWLHSQISDGETMFSRRQKQTIDTDQSDATKQTEDESVSSAIVTALFTICYAVGGYLIGFLWATPVFVFVYSRWNELTLISSITLAAVGFSTAYGFWMILNVPIDVGILTEVVVS